MLVFSKVVSCHCWPVSKLSFLRAKGKTTGGYTAHSSVLSCRNSPLEMESLLAGYVIGNYLIKYMVVNSRGSQKQQTRDSCKITNLKK